MSACAVLTFFRLVVRSVHRRSDLFSNQLLRVEPPHDVRGVAVGHRTAGVVEDEAEVLPLAELQVVEDLAPWL
jgi:hypothetical protein